MASGDILSAIASQKTLEEVKERLGEIGSSGKDISEILEELLSRPMVVKCIQSGTITGGKPTVELAGFSNISKMFALVMGSVKENSDGRSHHIMLNHFLLIAQHLHL